MNINETLINWAKKSKICKSIISEERYETLEKALSNNEGERYTNSVELMISMWPHELILTPFYKQLADSEYGDKFHANYRDHVAHMLKVFLLGLYMYEKISGIHDLFSAYKESEFISIWIITALYHDVGYLFETENGTHDGENSKALLEIINKALHNPLSNLFPDQFDCLLEERIVIDNRLHTPQINSIGDIDRRPASFQNLLAVSEELRYKKTADNAIQTYYNFTNQLHEGRKYYDHGIFSALLLLLIDDEVGLYIQSIKNIVDSLPLKREQITVINNYSITRDVCYQHVCIAAQAMALHNIHQNWSDQQKKDLLAENVYIDGFKILAEKTPFAYLLRICDEIQCWDRQKFRYLEKEEFEEMAFGKDVSIISNKNKLILHIGQDGIKKKIDAALKNVVVPKYTEWIEFASSKIKTTTVGKESNAIGTRKKTTSKNKPPIWLPDAELAIGEQTRFNNYTSTEAVKSVLDMNSPYWGIASVKGIGKTFVLQVKRVRTSKEFFCVPVEENPGPENNWATETLILDDVNCFFGQKFSSIVLLWKYAIECRVISAVLKYLSQNDKKDLYVQLINYLDRDAKIDSTTKRYITDTGAFDNVGRIIKNITINPKWARELIVSYAKLTPVTSKVTYIIKELTEKKGIVFFLDKFDQTLKQPTCEPAPDNCETCKKFNGVENCINPLKSDDYCKIKGDGECETKKIACCYGCEKFDGDYANTRMRVNLNNLKLSHINYWNYLQLALVEAVYQIKAEYAGRLRVYYTIRQEALNCDENVMHEQKKKFASLLKNLWYSREEQEKIFCDCINAESAKYLYAPRERKTQGLEYGFVGVHSLCHPYVKNEQESLFDSIFRHSFDRTRDIQEYGKALAGIIKDLKNYDDEKKREEEVKKTIETTAASLMLGDDHGTSDSLSKSYYSEKMDIMPQYWAEREHFKRLLMLIDKNLLFANDVLQICQKINNCTICSNDGKGCKECGCEHHPFSMLYRLGLLGLLTINDSNVSEEEQKFLHSKNVTYFHEEDVLNLDNKTCYIIHPALTKGIELIKKGNIMHFRGFILGKGLKVPKSVMRDIIKDHNEMTPEEFDQKYYYSNAQKAALYLDKGS